MEDKQKVITLTDIIGEKAIDNNKSANEANIETLPLGMKEIRIDVVQNTSQKVKFIENPLPVPKRKEHKQMDYAIELNPNNNDYDINDMTGIDFFDID